PVWGCDIDDSEDDEDIVKEDVPSFTSVETEEPSASSSPRAEAEIAQMKAQPSFPDLGQFNELLIQSLKNELPKILSTHDFSGSLRTELKDIPSRFTKLTDELKTLQWELPAPFISLPDQVAKVQARLKTLDALLSLFISVTNALNRSSKALQNTTQAGDTSVPSVGQASTMPAEGEKNTQATISQLFQRATERQSSNPQPKVTTTTLPPIPSIIISLPKCSTQTEGEHTKRDKGKKIMSPKVTEEENSDSGSDNDETDEVPGQMTRSSKVKKLKRFNYVTEGGKHVHLSKEDISQQKQIEEKAKAEAAA
ncbi:hypothetical protein Tco_1197931, partial [Tanacetum coccineum]